jgi:hypothetical protein
MGSMPGDAVAALCCCTSELALDDDNPMLKMAGYLGNWASVIYRLPEAAGNRSACTGIKRESETRN